MITKRIIVGAHYGLRDWLAQRITAIVMAVYTLILLLAILKMPALTYGNWATLFSYSWMKVATLLAMLCLLYHAWVGVRDIYMDYLQSTAIRLLLEALTILALVGYALWTVLILWRV